MHLYINIHWLAICNKSTAQTTSSTTTTNEITKGKQEKLKAKSNKGLNAEQVFRTSSSNNNENEEKKWKKKKKKSKKTSKTAVNSFQTRNENEHTHSYTTWKRRRWRLERIVKWIKKTTKKKSNWKLPTQKRRKGKAIDDGIDVLKKTIYRPSFAQRRCWCVSQKGENVFDALCCVYARCMNIKKGKTQR